MLSERKTLELRIVEGVKSAKVLATQQLSCCQIPGGRGHGRWSVLIHHYGRSENDNGCDGICEIISSILCTMQEIKRLESYRIPGCLDRTMGLGELLEQGELVDARRNRWEFDAPIS